MIMKYSRTRIMNLSRAQRVDAVTVNTVAVSVYVVNKSPPHG